MKAYKEEIRYFTADKGEPFGIELAGKSWCDGSYMIARENPDIWVLEYIIAGQGTVRVDGIRREKYYPGAGDVYLLPAGRRHSYFSDARDPWVKLFVNCRGPVVDGLADAYGLTDQILFHNMQHLEGKFQKIYAMVEDRTLAEGEVTAETELLIHDIFRQLGEQSRKEREETEEIRVIRQYLDTNVGQIVSVQEIADLVYRSPDYVIKHFKAEVGVTPYQYLLKKKMQIAERLLRDTVMPVGEVAMQLGYSDAHYFSGLFKKEKGMAPGKFRKEIHGI